MSRSVSLSVAYDQPEPDDDNTPREEAQMSDRKGWLDDDDVAQLPGSHRRRRMHDTRGRPEAGHESRQRRRGNRRLARGWHRLALGVGGRAGGRDRGGHPRPEVPVRDGDADTRRT